jgi:uncharacterized DUF497 family protein
MLRSALILDVHTKCTYNQSMKFEWDERKRRENLSKHGLDFVDAPAIFDSPWLARPDTRREYGEDRWIAIGVSKGRVVVVVFTELDNGEMIRIISMRKAEKHEQKEFETLLG